MAQAKDTEKGTRDCGHGGCKCTSDQYEGVSRDDGWYCSDGCAQNKGCTHTGCGCSSVAGKKPGAGGPDASIPGPDTKPVPKKNPGHLVDHNPGQGSPSTRRMP